MESSAMRNRPPYEVPRRRAQSANASRSRDSVALRCGIEILRSMGAILRMMKRPTPKGSG
jgi:hypothetical protein